MTDKPTFHPKSGKIDLGRPNGPLPKAAQPRGGFDTSTLGHWSGGPKGPKGKPMQLPRKSGSR